LVSLTGATLTGCHSAPAPDPVAIFEETRNDFLHGNLDVAQKKAEKARNDFSASDGDWPMKFRVLQAEILTYQGRRPEVLALLSDPHTSYPGTGDLAIKRNLLCAMAHARLGQPQQADSELAQAQHLSDASHSPLAGEVLRTEATVQNYRGHLTEAADLFRKSLKVAREDRDGSFLEASDLLNLGMVAVEMEHYDEAVASLNEAASFAKSVQARLVLEAALGNLGAAYYHTGDFEKALSSFQQAGQESREIGTTSAQVDWLWDAGSAYSRLGDLQQAKTCYEQSLKAAKAIDNREEIEAIEADLAFLLFEQGQFDSAKTYSDEAIRMARSSGDQNGELEPLFLQALLAARQPNGQDGERLLQEVYRKSGESPSMRWRIEDALANYYAGKKQTRQAIVWYRKSINTFEDQRAAVKDETLRLPFFANGDTLYRDYADFLIASEKQEAALELLDIGRARTLQEGLGLAKTQADAQPERALDAQAVARKLDSLILFYSLGPEKSWLWVVAPHHTHLFPLPGQATIDTQVRNYQNAILKSSDPLRDANPAARMLYDTLVGPAAALIPKDSKLLIIPDGVLNGLNFETLLTPESNGSHYWIEDVTIRNANSIRMVSHLDQAASPESANKLLLIGNPTAAGTGYDSLVNAFAEIRGIENHFPQDTRTVVTQSAAVPAAYAQNNPDEFSYVHFVAHGTASRLDPLDSAVVLSPSPDNPDNFKLYARDIMRCPLHARLVTISSCYGSGLRAYAGEGLVGLSWAFLRAGAHNVIGALWEVNDASTPLLMDHMYGELEAGKSPDVALRAAKLSLIHSPAVYRKPLYWGAFQLYTGS
jgi:CHAT domain-containing protein/tetratricopeptide (TPR) repeat protein